MVLALVGAPSKLSWEAYKAAKAAGGALGALLGAAESAALAAIALKTAAVLGAGVGGFFIGQAILAQLQPETSMPDMGEYFEAGNPQQLVRLRFDYYVNDQQIFSNQPSQFLVAPVKGIFFRVINGASTWFVFDGNGQQQNIVSTSNTPEGTRFDLKGFIGSDSTPVTPTKRLPSYVPTRPDIPTFAPPTTVPIPGTPGIPVTPIAVPNPGNDDPTEGGEREPGVVVQIPQTGTQIRYTPSGVQITNYNAPNREPFRVPPLQVPTGGKAATPECCPTEDVDLDEVLCRLKALENGLLDDGFDFATASTPDAKSGRVFDAGKVFDVVRIFVTSRPSNLPVQRSDAPAQDVWFVGWFSWLVSGKEGERIPLHFQESAFIAPEGVDGFVYQLGYGSTGFASYSTKTKKDYVDVC